MSSYFQALIFGVVSGGQNKTKNCKYVADNLKISINTILRIINTCFWTIKDLLKKMLTRYIYRFVKALARNHKLSSVALFYLPFLFFLLLPPSFLFFFLCSLSASHKVTIFSPENNYNFSASILKFTFFFFLKKKKTWKCFCVESGFFKSLVRFFLKVILTYEVFFFLTFI